jgi:predicted nucleic acid-binding protein
MNALDALIVAACIDAGVDTLYTEDFGGSTTIVTLRIINPFVQAS